MQEPTSQLNQNKWLADLWGCFWLCHPDCSTAWVDKMIKGSEVHSALSQFWVSPESLTRIRFFSQISNTHGAKYKAFNSERGFSQDSWLEEHIFPYHQGTLKKPTACFRFFCCCLCSTYLCVLDIIQGGFLMYKLIG